MVVVSIYANEGARVLLDVEMIPPHAGKGLPSK